MVKKKVTIDFFFYMTFNKVWKKNVEEINEKRFSWNFGYKHFTFFHQILPGKFHNARLTPDKTLHYIYSSGKWFGPKCTTLSVFQSEVVALHPSISCFCYKCIIICIWAFTHTIHILIDIYTPTQCVYGILESL